MVGRGVLREYVRGSLWVLLTLSVVVALAAGAALSSVSVGSRSPLAFQGTPDDARTLLLGITGTMITVIALLLGLAVVALQLSSTQFSPRLLRNFLRDRPNQVVLSAFVATFAYCAGSSAATGPASRPSRTRCCGCSATAPPSPEMTPSGARPSKRRPGSSSPTPNEKSPSPPTSTSRTPKRSPCSTRSPRTGRRHSRPTGSRTSPPLRRRPCDSVNPEFPAGHRFESCRGSH